MKISVSILKEHDNIIDAIKKVNASICDYVHIDVMDGIFVNNKRFPLEKVMEVKELSTKPIDLHLMVKDINEIKKYISINPKYFTFHVEVINDDSLINYVKSNNIKVGLAINPNTDVKALFPYLDKIDMVLIMSVYPGEGGQKFIPEVLDKIKYIKSIRPDILISIDGGVNSDTIDMCYENECDIVVSGSFITNASNYDDMIKELLK